MVQGKQIGLPMAAQGSWLNRTLPNEHLDFWLVFNLMVTMILVMILVT